MDSTYVSIDLDLLREHPEPGNPNRASEAAYLRKVGNADRRAAAIAAKLEADAWSVTSLLGLVLTARHPDVRTRAQARLRLAVLGIDQTLVRIESWPSRRRSRKLVSRPGPTDHKSPTADRNASKAAGRS